MPIRSQRLFLQCLVAALFIGAFVFPSRVAVASSDHWTWPLDPRPTVARTFDAPDTDYSSGHRGVDLLGEPGAWIRAVDDGVVAFVGTIAGVGVITIDHGGVKSTYQPVSATAAVGDSVRAGDPIGRLLLAGTHCGLDACLHLGRKVGDAYLDPLELLDSSARVRLITPMGPPPAPPVDIGAAGPGALGAPVTGPITSPFGMRLHPITGIFKLHDGTDFGVSCGTPVHAAADGVVTGQYFNTGYGNRVIVDHGSVDGRAVTTAYNHLATATVEVGQHIRRGQTVGLVGATGYATGCHLHFMVLVNGTAVDPMGWL